MIQGSAVKRDNYEIVGSYNNQRSQAISPERTINMFEYIDVEAKRPHCLLSTSGLVDQGIIYSAASATSAFRMEFVFNDALFSVVGNTLYRQTIVAGSFVTTVAGTLLTSAGYLGFDANQTQILIVDGTNGYIYSDVTGFRLITDPGFPPRPIDCCNLDGFFVVANGATNNFYLSDLNNGLTWSSLPVSTFTMASGSHNMILSGGTTAYLQVGTPFTISAVSDATKLALGLYYVVSIVSASTFTFSATLGGAPVAPTGDVTGSITTNGQLQIGSITAHYGTIVACRTLHRRLFLFSQNYTEVWENQGLGTNLPFRRNNSLLIEYGTPSADSVAADFDYLAFLSQSAGGLGPVQLLAGASPRPISTSALDYQLTQYAAAGQVSDANGMLINENGLIFFRLNFTAANHTFVYNVTQSTPDKKLWHEEEKLNGDRHPAQTHAYFQGNNYVGSYNSPTLYKIDPNWFLNGTERIKRTRIGKPLMPAGNYRIRIDRFVLDLLQGSVLNLISTQTILDLLTEDSFTLQDESGNDLLLEQETLTITQEALQVWLSLSKDSGQSFGNMIPSPMGKVGDRTFLTLWRKLGVVPENQAFVPKIEFFNDAAFAILSASWVYEVLPR